ncbi:hypothetical protein ANCDUO_26922, partial [Ancylostoma duodenale]
MSAHAMPSPPPLPPLLPTYPCHCARLPSTSAKFTYNSAPHDFRGEIRDMKEIGYGMSPGVFGRDLAAFCYFLKASITMAL